MASRQLNIRHPTGFSDDAFNVFCASSEVFVAGIAIIGFRAASAEFTFKPMKKIVWMLLLIIPMWIAFAASAPKWLLLVASAPFWLFMMYTHDDSDDMIFGDWTDAVQKTSWIIIGMGGVVFGIVAFILWAAYSK